jgi:hypothetical protein
MNQAIEMVPRSVLAASFLTKQDAHEAAAVLKQQGFKNIWIGLTVDNENERFYGPLRNAGDVRIRAENKLECFFDTSEETLHNRLIRRGVPESALHHLDLLPLNAAVLTVENGSHPREAMRIVETAGGRCYTPYAREGDLITHS